MLSNKTFLFVVGFVRWALKALVTDARKICFPKTSYVPKRTGKERVGKHTAVLDVDIMAMEVQQMCMMVDCMCLVECMLLVRM